MLFDLRHSINSKFCFYVAEHNHTQDYSYSLPISEMDNTDNLTDVESRCMQKYMKEMKRNLEKQNESLGKQEMNHQKEIVTLSEKIKALETEKSEQSKQIMGLQHVIDKNRQELNSIRSELQQHKARALKTLQEKEKLIMELKGNPSATIDDATVMELNQLK